MAVSIKVTSEGCDFSTEIIRKRRKYEDNHAASWMSLVCTVLQLAFSTAPYSILRLALHKKCCVKDRLKAWLKNVKVDLFVF